MLSSCHANRARLWQKILTAQPRQLRYASNATNAKPYGYLPPPRIAIQDYTEAELNNRNLNAPLLRYVDSVRRHGHRAATLDPLDLMEREASVAALSPQRYGLQPDKEYDISGIVEMGDRQPSTSRFTAKQITEHLRRTYVSNQGYEFMHSASKAARNWFMSFLETGQTGTHSKKDRLRAWQLMAQSESLDRFLQLKLPNVKRYGLEGAESMLPALDTLFSAAASTGIASIVLCMPHRGRLSLLTELLQFPHEALFNKLRGNPEVPATLIGATGDVLSHLAAHPTLSYSGSDLKVELLQNPSHLEAVGSTAMGKVRAKQTFGSTHGDSSAVDKTLCVQIHGDAAVTGQGVVMETLGLSELPHFAVSGSIHIVVNNALGYTTPSSEGRSSLYASDIAKMIGAPAIHVNGDDPESVMRAMSVALAYRNEFKRDCVLDLLTYRRWGHNELDEPSFTQPTMYRSIRARRSVPELYEEKLVQSSELDTKYAKAFREAHREKLEKALKASEAFQPAADHLEGKWGRAGIVWPASEEAVHDPSTGVQESLLVELGKESVSSPPDFHLHPRLERHVKQRIESIEKRKGINWATAEALAFSSLLEEGQHVRISGQDVGRGTFSQRHAMFVDQETEAVHIPLNDSRSSDDSERRGKLELANSSLSEQAVLAFEVGVSWERPDVLTCWEAQFGDFGDGAQVTIDTFISSSEAKWLKQSALTLLLPHGYDGAGPEHSSARIERYLQLTNDPFEPSHAPYNPNLGLVNPSTPAQYFHVLRRQMKRNYRKPLIVIAPKGLLRSPVATSTLGDMAPGTRFQPVLPCPLTSSAPSTVRRVVLCSGKHYYTLLAARSERKLDTSVALVRLEQLSPFPFDTLADVLRPYYEDAGSGSESIGPEWVWAQEEPRNQGAWPHVAPRLQALLDSLAPARASTRVHYAGRKESAVTATGVSTWHKAELGPLVEAALGGL